MDENNSNGALTVRMIEEAVKIAESNFGAPDSLMMSDDTFAQLKHYFDPEYEVKADFNNAMEKLLHIDQRNTDLFKIAELLLRGP